MAERTSARSRGVAFGSLLLGAVAGLVTGSQPWWRARGSDTDVPFTGTDATAGLTQALGAVVLAGVVLALVLQAAGRRVLAVLLLLAGLAITLIGVLRVRPGVAAIEAKLRQTTLLADYRLEPTGWSYGFAAAGLVVLLGAAVMLVRAGRWPRRADRFTRTNELVSAEAAKPVAEQDPSVLWKAQDVGLDPTQIRQKESRE